MVFLRRKKIKGNTYYYAVKKERVDGQPRDAQHVYLGSAEKILEKMKGEGKEEKGKIRLKTFEYGKIASILSIDEELGFSEVVDEVVDKRKQEGMSVGEYMLLVIFGRWLGPLSKKATGEKFSESFLNLARSLPHEVNAQNILNQMDYLTEENIKEIEKKVAQNLVSNGVDVNALIWDTSNNFTFVEETEELLEKGYSKQKRFDKNLVGYGISVTDSGIPLLHETYPASTHDSKVFNQLVDRMVERLKEIDISTKSVAIIMDRGNNSKENVDKVLEDVHLVGACKRKQIPDAILDIPIEEYGDCFVDRNDNQIRAYRTETDLFHREFTLVMKYNPDTYKKQKKTYEEKKKDIIEGLEDLDDRLHREGRGRKMTISGAIRRANKLIPDQYSSVFKFEGWTEEKEKKWKYWIEEEKEKELISSFGKQGIFTDLDSWDTEKIVKSYDSKWRVENDFHWLTDKLFIPVTPMYVRKDEHIRAHVFLCFMALLFFRYLMWKIDRSQLSPEGVFEELEKIRVGLVAEDDLSDPQLVVEEMTPEQSTLFSSLNMEKFLEIN